MRRFALILILIALVSSLAADPPNWQIITGTQYSMVMIAQATLYGTPLLGNNGSMIAAFGPGGETDCRSVAVWQPANPPEDGFWYFTIVGNLGGEIISFKIYDAVTDLIYNCNETIIFQDNTTIGNTTAPFQLTVQECYLSGVISLITTSLPAGNLTEVEVLCNGEITHPSAAGYYLFSLSNGIYDVTASLNGYTTVTLTDLLLQGNQGINNADISLIDWELISGTQYSMVVMSTAQIFGNPIYGGEGNIVAAFGPNGDEDCRAIAEWQPANPPYWDGYWYFTIVGNLNGETIQFKIFDLQTQTIYDCYQTLEFIDNQTIGSPEQPFFLSNGLSQSFDLNENWNWISFNVHPDDTAIEAVFCSLEDNVSQIKSQDESTIYYSPTNTWIGDLLQIEDGKGYLVQMINPVTSFIVEGSSISASTAISLDQNWNWVAYYPQISLEIEAALNSIEDNVFQVKSQTQSATYYTPPGIWTGDLAIMEPAKSYKIKMNSADELVYLPSDRELPISNNPLLTMDPPGWQVISGTEYSMVLMANVFLDGEVFSNDSDNMIAAFGPAGDDDCRSIAAWQQPNPPFYEGFWYFTIVGNTNGEEISFQLYDELTDQIFSCNETIIFENNETIGNPENPFLLTADLIGSSDDQIKFIEQVNLHIYPNPFNPSTTISFLLTTEDTELVVYNIKGQKVKSLSVQGSQNLHVSLTWNGDDENSNPVSSGIYFFNLVVKGKTEAVKKCLLLK